MPSRRHPRIVINGSPRRQIMRQQLPGAAAADYREDAIQDFTASMLGGTAARFGGGHQRLQLVPFGIGEVGSVGIAGFHPASLRDTFSNALLVLFGVFQQTFRWATGFEV